MIAILTGDLIHSSRIPPKIWMTKLKEELLKLGSSPEKWEIYRGDSFQLMQENPLKALETAISLKAALKTIKYLDVRISIGIGEMDYKTPHITECNGSAFEFSGNRFENLKTEKLNLAIKSKWPDFDQDINLYLKLALVIMDNWTVNASSIVHASLENPHLIQKELGELLGLKQNSVSSRLKRAQYPLILEVMSMYRQKLKLLI